MKMKLPNGFGSITKLSGNRRRPFMVRKTIARLPNGRQLMEVVGYFEKYTDAMKALIQYNETGEVKVTIAGRYYNTFENVWDDFTEDKYTKHGKDINPSYISAYNRCHSLYKLEFSKIKLFQLEKVQDSAPSQATKRDIKVLLNQMYKFAMKRDICDKNLAEFLENAKIERSNIHQPFTEDEIKRLWKNASVSIGCRLWLILIYTGLRPGELVAIKTENVHLDEDYMIGGLKTKFSKDRMIPIAKCIKPFIKEFYDPDTEKLINDDDGAPMNRDMQKWRLDTAAKQLNFKHLPHDGRHTTATLLDSLGVNLLTIQNILGHSPQSTAGKVYIHKTLTDMLEAINKLPYYPQV